MIMCTHKNLATNTVPEEDVEKLEILRDKIKEESEKIKIENPLHSHPAKSH